jgi:hypothetical protein
MAREMEIQILGMDSMDPGMMMAQAEAEGAIGDLRDMEEAEFEAMAPQGDFSKAALNSLVRSEGVEVFPSRFVRELMMIAQAVADAIDEGVVDEEMMIDLSDVASDRDLARLAGRLDSLSRDKDFRRFLKEGPSEGEVSEEEVAESVPMDEMGDDEIESLMMDRV